MKADALSNNPEALVWEECWQPTNSCPLCEVSKDQSGWRTCPNHTAVLFVGVLLVW